MRSASGPDGARRAPARDAGVPAPLPLAVGELSEQDARELQSLKTQIRRQSGLLCDGYKHRCLRRRLAVRMRARGVHRYADYAALLRADPAEYERLIAALMINVSKFFRNAEVWQALRSAVLPELFSLKVPAVRVWSAGSAAGEELYSLAILLLEYAEAHGCRDRLGRFQLVGWDIDADSLAAARRAVYPELALSETPPSIRARWFEAGPLHRLRAEPKRMVRFVKADLIGTPFPRGQHLIVCRNVIIYFERPLQEALFERFHDALAPGGYLVLGKVEALFGRIAHAFAPVAGRERIFRRS